MSRFGILLLLPIAALLGCTPTQAVSDEQGLRELEEQLSSLRLAPEATSSQIVIPPTTPRTIERVEGLMLPLQGRLAARFGDLREGLKLRGILIRGAPGGEVKACSEGMVVQAYERFPGLGCTIMIDWGKGMRAVYAKQGENLVRQGDRVGQGQIIARLFESGNQQPILYFCLYREGLPIDPLTLLPAF